MNAKAQAFRDVLSCFERGDVDGVRKLFAAGIVGTSAPGWPEQGPFEGCDAIVGQFERLSADWEHNRISKFEVFAEDDDWVVVNYRWSVRGAKSGLETHFDLATAVRLADGGIDRLHFAWTPQEACEFVGIAKG